MVARNKWTLGLRTLVMISTLLIPTLNSKAQEQAQKSPAEVKIDNFSFGPKTLTVSVGTEVTWINRDDIPHNIVSTDGVFESKVRDTNETFSYKFVNPGTYPYYCSLHPKMTGKIVVH